MLEHHIEEFVERCLHIFLVVHRLISKISAFESA